MIERDHVWFTREVKEQTNRQADRHNDRYEKNKQTKQQQPNTKTQ
jgi:hypothetical protein